MTDVPAFGIYEELHHGRLEETLRRHPELRSVFGKLDPEEGPSRYTAFVARVLEQALGEESEPAVRLEIANQVIGLISGFRHHEHLADRALLPGPEGPNLSISRGVRLHSAGGRVSHRRHLHRQPRATDRRRLRERIETVGDDAELVPPLADSC